MKFILFLLLITNITLNATDNSDMILQEIKHLREDMNKRFEQVDKRFEQVDKRFEQVDKRFDLMQKNMDYRFEQMDKRLDFMQNILYALMGLIFASPFIAIYLKDKKEIEDRKIIDNVKAMMFILRELAQDDEKIAKAMRSASLM